MKKLNGEPATDVMGAVPQSVVVVTAQDNAGFAVGAATSIIKTQKLYVIVTVLAIVLIVMAVGGAHVQFVMEEVY